jgi:8-oxo-dGTP diphosphatase
MQQDVYHTFHVGVNVFIVRDGRLLLGKRKNIFGDGTWGLPGGHLEPGESMIEAAGRELMEETGLRAEGFEFSNIASECGEGKDHIQIGFATKNVEGDPELKEPDRCSAWDWFALDALPDVFPPHLTQIENFISKTPFGER